MNRVILSPGYYPSTTSNRALANANIYVGEPDTDPTVVINQKSISVLEEDGSTTPVSQPVSTNSGGVPTYGGSPVTILVEGQYSLKVLNSAGSQVYYVPNIQLTTPAEIDDESVNDAAARAVLDPYPGAALDKAESLQEEIQQLRYVLAQITGETYWYIDPDSTIAALNTLLNAYDVLTTRGDIIIEGAAVHERLALGNQGQFLASDDTDIAWGVPAAMNGFLIRPSFVHVNDTDIQISPGSYQLGTTDQIVYWNSTLTFALSHISGGGSESFQYIYLDESAIITHGSPLLDNTCFRDSTSSPVWSSSKNGYYGPGASALDRCIFAVQCDATDDIIRFYNDGGRYVEYQLDIADLVPTDIDTTETAVPLTIPTFAKRAQVNFYGRGGDSSLLYYGASAGTTEVFILEQYTANQRPANTCSVYVDSSLEIHIVFSAATGNLAAVNTLGYFLPRGM